MVVKERQVARSYSEVRHQQKELEKQALLLPHMPDLVSLSALHPSQKWHGVVGDISRCIPTRSTP